MLVSYFWSYLIFEKNNCLSDLLTILVCDKCYHVRKINLFSRLNKLMHVENWKTNYLQHYLYVDSSYKFTLVWVFVSHACTQMWFGTFYRDNSVLIVLMRVLHIQLSWVLTTFIIFVNCILNDIAWEQALQWGGKGKKLGQVGYIAHCYMQFLF